VDGTFNTLLALYDPVLQTDIHVAARLDGPSSSAALAAVLRNFELLTSSYCDRFAAPQQHQLSLDARLAEFQANETRCLTERRLRDNRHSDFIPDQVDQKLQVTRLRNHAA
jgi:hypothetical protein